MPVTDRDHGRPVDQNTPGTTTRRGLVALVLATLALCLAVVALIIAVMASDGVAKLTSVPGTGTSEVGGPGQ